jgi:glucoamylase
MPPLQYAAVQTALQASSFDAIAPRMRCLMLRNVAERGYRFADADDATRRAESGCIIASPSYPADDPNTDQNYVHNWTRDAALTAMELEAQALATDDFARDYVAFAALCQHNAKQAGKFDYACFDVDGALRTKPEWSCQSDGPALQTLAVMALWGHLEPVAEVRAQAEALVAENLRFLLGAYTKDTKSLWEENTGGSFFARAVQRRCFEAVKGHPVAGAVAADELDRAIGWLDDALAAHWDEAQGCYRTFHPAVDDYDPNIDIVLAALYGSIPTTDGKLLATAAKLHRQWSPGGDVVYAINVADVERDIGPLLGRYPNDYYDGDGDRTGEGHPWALCTCAFAELCYRVAAGPTGDARAAPFFAQVGATPAELRDAGDRMLRAVVFHSDHLELSEQFDRTTGFEKSVRNLTWSYSSFLAAVRARAAVAGA